MRSNESEFLHHEPCPNCGSSDGLARYSDGHAHCFVCQHYEHGGGVEVESKVNQRKAAGLLRNVEYKALPKVGFSEEDARKWRYGVGNFNGEPVQVAEYVDPATGEVVFQKLRTKNKEFITLGDGKSDVFYGEHLWRDGGKRIVITEGEKDAISVSKMQDHRWPVTSLPKGSAAARKSVEKKLKWLSKFETVVLLFDNDEAGKKAAAEVAPLFAPGQCKIARLPLKDANDMLKAGRGEEIITAIWEAKDYRPDGVVTLTEIREKVMRPVEMGLPWYLPTLTAYTFGRRYGEIYALGAGTGIGKTDFITEQMQFDMTELRQPIGVFALEQQPEETAKRLLGKFANKTFHIPDGSWSQSDLVKAYETVDEAGKLFMYDNFGATDWQVIKQTIRFLNHSEGVRIFYLDHLTALAAAEEDERKALEQIMAEMGALVKELGIIIILISHLATPEGKPHEEGGRVMIRHFKGSRAIGFWCAYMFGMERAQQHKDVEKRRTTTFRILKDRYTGRATGEVFFLGYDPDKGRLFEKDKAEWPEDEETDF